MPLGFVKKAVVIRPAEPEPTPFYEKARGQAVGDSADLRRILALPRRERPSDADLLAIAADLKRRFGKPSPAPVGGSCPLCAPRRCCAELLPVQAWALHEAEQYGGILGPIGVGHGKALALDTPIPTPSGWTTMGNICVGDKVFDSAGRVCSVTHVTEVQHGRECFDVKFSDGSVIVADADHRWLTRSYLERRSLDRGTQGIGSRPSRPHEPKVRTTLEIRDSLYHRHNKNHSVDVAGTLDLPETTLPLDPYLLGAWLGDGSTRQGEITSADVEILALFDKHYTRGHFSRSGAAITQYYIGLQADLRALGVLENKHVPAVYLRASPTQRLLLLQGLMDTDGFANKDSVVEFCNTNKLLADAVFELSASLGQLPKMYEGRATIYGKDCGPKYRVCWQPTIDVFRLGRKSKNLRLGRYKQSQIKSRRYIESVTPRASVPVKCITVDSPDHSYLCGEAMIITHNTLLDMLTPMVVGAKRAVLLLPPNLKRQFLEVDWKFYGNHWRLPNLSTGKEGWTPGVPFLYVIAYSELSGSKSTALLEGLKPDVIILDEAHNVRNSTAARTKRFLRYLKQAPDTRLFCWSGTLTSRSLHDYGHLATHALGEGSPLPNSYPALEEWSSALDPSDFPSPAGRLLLLGESGDVRERFRGRLVSTAGVVSSGDAASCQASLVISERKVETPAVVKQHIDALEATWQRPDGEEIVDALSKARCARELSCGFFYRWRWPRGEPVPVIENWLSARKEWRKELREKLKTGKAHMDSPLLCTKAAIRWEEGYTHVERDRDGNELRRFRVDPHTRNGPLPTWESAHWARWKEVRDTAKPETEAVWLDDFLVEDALAWLAEGPGLLWYEFGGFAARVVRVASERKAKLLWCGPGDDGNRRVLELQGSEACVISTRAHGTGKNLQAFARNLVANPPSDGATWEQLLGRTHRTGQQADEVTFAVYRHTAAFREAVEKARDFSEYIEGTGHGRQRLASVATWAFDDGLEEKLKASLTRARP